MALPNPEVSHGRNPPCPSHPGPGRQAHRRHTVVIALHAAALMLLLVPITSPEPVAREDDPIVITFKERQEKPLPIVVPIQPVRPVTRQAPTTRPVEVPVVPSEMIYDDGTEIAIPDIGPVVDTTFDTGAPTVQALVPIAPPHRRIRPWPNGAGRPAPWCC